MSRPEPEPIRPALWWAFFGILGAAVALVLFFLSDTGAVGPEPDEPAVVLGDRPRVRDRSPRSSGGGGAHFASGPAVDAGAVPASPEEAERRARERDPQLFASQRSFGPPDAGTLPPFGATLRTGRVASIEGESPVHVGASCDVRVLPVRTSRFNCLVRVMCDGVVLYPDQRQVAGYAPCELDPSGPVRALDDGVTHADGDPTVRVDFAAREVEISDEGPGVPRFRATVRVDALPVRI